MLIAAFVWLSGSTVAIRHSSDATYAKRSIDRSRCPKYRVTSTLFICSQRDQISRVRGHVQPCRRLLLNTSSYSYFCPDVRTRETSRSSPAQSVSIWPAAKMAIIQPVDDKRCGAKKNSVSGQQRVSHGSGRPNDFHFLNRPPSSGYGQASERRLHLSLSRLTNLMWRGRNRLLSASRLAGYRVPAIRGYYNHANSLDSPRCNTYVHALHGSPLPQGRCRR